MALLGKGGGGGRGGEVGGIVFQAKCLPSLAPPALSLGLVAYMMEAPPGCGVGGRPGRGSDLRSPSTLGPLHKLLLLPDIPFYSTLPSIPLAQLTPIHPMNLLPGGLLIL